MPYMFPILTDRPHTKISSKTYRQSMPYIYPEAGRERKNEICGAKKSKSLKKSTLRAKKKTIVTGENLDSATGPIKKLDPAKITHSIPDFVSRNQIHTPYICQYLESTLPISNINTCRVLNPYFGTSLLQVQIVSCRCSPRAVDASGERASGGHGASRVFCYLISLSRF